ncbi:TIR domain-containing protein [Saccharothrix sp. BKS2]|uniref:nSTAND1 domain-containing NTPase n=1 Tax=Saccharothrix sp. BKS2 TaxID=3064400 RepID=UPI0039E901BF
MDGVFVSYRTGDGDWAATLVARELESRFGADRVFLASRTIRPGDDFTEQIDRWLDRSDVLLAVIGPRWLTASNGRGRRLDEPGDWVRYEIATALASGVRVIPVLLDGAEPPAEADLPPGTGALARSHVLRLRHGNDDRDISRLVDELAALAPAGRTEPTPAGRPAPGFRPYRGLETFREEDAALFHGRDREAARLRELVSAHPVVVVAGASGSGKSSLVRAALVPRLRAGGARVAVFRPVVDTSPVAGLLSAVRAEVGADLADRLDRDEVRLWADPLAAGVGRLVLVVDQFEELVAAAPDQAAELFDLAAALAGAASTRPGGPPALGVVLTVRGTDVDALPTGGLARALESSGVFVPRMGPAELRTAVEAPVAGVASFEAGLVERIVRDAGDAPGRLALVQFALTRLWETAPGGVLAHEAYDRIGGVAGALAGYADELLTRPPWPEEAALVERLLVQLARPVDSGGFVASPARLDRFGPELRAVAARLSANRLVVIRQDAGQPEVVALAHEALLREWPRLRSWLVAARDFRSWQERLRVSVDQWLDADRDPAALPRGAPLARAEEWLAGHGDRLTGVEREYVLAGRGHRAARERAAATRIRRLRQLLALLVVLVVTAGALAVTTVLTNREIGAQLRTQDARVMGRDSLVRVDGDPGGSLRLALTAWHTDPGAPEAYAALLQQRLRLGQAVRIHPAPWTGALVDWLSSADGSVTAALAGTERGTVLTVWPGTLDGDPGPWSVEGVPGPTAAALDHDGGRLAAVGEDRRIGLWDVASRTRLAVLDQDDGPRAEDSRDVLAFAPDGRRLLHVHETGSGGRTRQVSIRVWDVERREPVQVRADGLPPRRSDFRLGADGRSLVVSDAFSPDEVIVFDLETGRERHRFESAVVAGRGASVLTCAGSAVQVFDAATGARQRTVDLPDCAVTRLNDADTTGRYVVEHRMGSTSGSGRYEVLVLLDLATGRRHAVTAPSGPDGVIGNLTATPRSDGSALLAAPFGTAVVALRAPQAPSDLGRPSGTPVGDGGHEVDVVGDEVLLLAAGGRVAARRGAPHVLDPTIPLGRPTFAPTADGSRLAVAVSGRVTVYSVPDLTPVRTFRLPSRADPDRPCDQERWGVDLFSAGDREVTAVCEGLLTRWPADSGGPVDPPLDLDARGPERDGDVEVLPRPGHPDEVLVLADRRHLEVWDVRDRAARGRIAFALRAAGSDTGSLVPDPAGKRLAVRHEGGTITLWDLDTGGELVRAIPPGAAVREVLGFGPHDTLLLRLDQPDPNAVQVRDIVGGRVLAVVHPPEMSHDWRLDGDRLVTGWAGPLLTLDPAGWYRDLCALPGRDRFPDAPTHGRDEGLCS